MSAPQPNATSSHYLVALSMLLVLVAGCTGMAERIVGRRITRQADRIFDLQDQQKDATRDAVDRLIDIAPDLLRTPIDTFVTSLDAALASGLTDENLRGLGEELDAMSELVVVPIMDEVAPLLVTLNDAQIVHGEKHLKKRFDDQRKELQEPAAERLEERQDKFVDNVEDWTGSLTDDQERKLRQYIATAPDHAAARILASERRTARVLDALKAHPGLAGVRAALDAEWQRRDDWGPDTPPGEQRRREARETLIYVDRLMTNKQRAHARAHLRKMHRRIKRFVGDGES